MAASPTLSTGEGECELHAHMLHEAAEIPLQILQMTQQLPFESSEGNLLGPQRASSSFRHSIMKSKKPRLRQWV